MLPLLPMWFVYIAAAMRIIGGFAYLRATLIGKAKPNPVSWLLWGIIPIIVFIAELQAGVGLVALVTLAVGISPILVFFAAIHKNRRSFELRGFNLLCALIAVSGIILWINNKNPEIAIIIMILADIASALPTIKKILQKPNSEFPPSYLLSASSMVIALLAVSNWTFAAVAYPIYVLAINLIIFYLTTRPRKQINKKRSPAKRHKK